MKISEIKKFVLQIEFPFQKKFTYIYQLIIYLYTDRQIYSLEIKRREKFSWQFFDLKSFPKHKDT